MYRYPDFFIHSNDIHGCVGSWPEHFRVVCDLESSLRLGHRLSSIAIVPLKTTRAQRTPSHTIIISSNCETLNFHKTCWRGENASGTIHVSSPNRHHCGTSFREFQKVQAASIFYTCCVYVTDSNADSPRRCQEKFFWVSRMCEQPSNMVPFCATPHKNLEFWKHITRSFIGGAQDRNELNTA